MGLELSRTLESHLFSGYGITMCKARQFQRVSAYAERSEQERPVLWKSRARKPEARRTRIHTCAVFFKSTESDSANFLLEKPRLYKVSLRPGSFVGSSCLKQPSALTGRLAALAVSVWLIAMVMLQLLSSLHVSRTTLKDMQALISRNARCLPHHVRLSSREWRASRESE